MPTNEQKAEWTALKAAWRENSRRVMPPKLFSALFFDGDLSREAVVLARKSPFVRSALKEAAAGVVDLSDRDVMRVWMSLQDAESIDDLFTGHRKRRRRDQNSDFVRKAVSALEELKGRDFVRQKSLGWWSALEAHPGHQEALVKEMVHCGIHDQEIYCAMGGTALSQARGAPTASGRTPFSEEDASPFASLAQKPPSSRIASRFDALFAGVTLAADLRDACLAADEHRRLVAPASPFISSSAFGRAVHRLRRSKPRRADEFSRALAHFAQTRPPSAAAAADPSSLRFPVLRLLHLQQILEAPNLSTAVEDPALMLVPEVALYLMGRDDVLFQPELRILRDTGRRWRARWVESAGEAIATMFLEDSVQLDLSTLWRIPEKNRVLTPDFMAGSFTLEKLVFEAKGSSGWDTHLAQRKHALEQLGKVEAEGGRSWASEGRTFACSLFAAQQGDERSSLFHVDDPPFQFEDLFHEGWEHRCRREHAIAVLEAARLFDRADDLASRHRREKSNFSREETFRVPGGEGLKDGLRFVGTYLPMGEWARIMRHPRPKECERIRIFVGVDETLARQFGRGAFPEGARHSRLEQSPTRSNTPYPHYRFGLLPGQNGPGTSRGMYSILADGAFMSLEFV